MNETDRLFHLKMDFGKFTGARRRILELLSDGREHTTVEIIDVGGTSGTRRLRELRAMGVNIGQAQLKGSNLWVYWLENRGDTHLNLPSREDLNR